MEELGREATLGDESLFLDFAKYYSAIFPPSEFLLRFVFWRVGHGELRVYVHMVPLYMLPEVTKNIYLGSKHLPNERRRLHDADSNFVKSNFKKYVLSVRATFKLYSVSIQVKPESRLVECKIANGNAKSSRLARALGRDQ